MRIITLLTIVLTVLIINTTLFAQEGGGMQFLTIGPDATSLAVSEAHTALDLGASSLFINPANLRFRTQNEFSLSHSLWIGETQNTQASFLFDDNNQTFGVGLRTSVIGDIEARTTPGEATGLFNVRYLSIAGAYARSLGSVNLGVTAMYLNEQLFEQTASGYGINVGISTSLLQDRIRTGAAITNIGEMDKLAELSSPLPTAFRAGIAADVIQFSIYDSDEIPLLISLSSDFVIPMQDFNISDDNSAIAPDDFYFTMGLGVEIAELITIYSGYRTGNTTRPLSFGAAINASMLTFNYAFVPFDTGFGSTHTISVSYRL